MLSKVLYYMVGGVLQVMVQETKLYIILDAYSYNSCDLRCPWPNAY